MSCLVLIDKLEEKKLTQRLLTKTGQFNASHGVNQRTCTQLKSLWKNMKSRTKSAVAKNRREKAKTGGGPQTDTGLEPLVSNFLNVSSANS